MKGTSSRAKATAPCRTTSGCWPGVKTFYVDEEHSKLPTNQKVLNALTELLETGDQKNEDNLWKGIGTEFAADRGIGEESQATMLAAEASRRAARLQQAAMLRASLQSRGDLHRADRQPRGAGAFGPDLSARTAALAGRGSTHRHRRSVDALYPAS